MGLVVEEAMGVPRPGFGFDGERVCEGGHLCFISEMEGVLERSEKEKLVSYVFEVILYRFGKSFIGKYFLFSFLRVLVLFFGK